MDDRTARVRALYRAFVAADRDTAESILADEFRFSSPYDVGLDRDGYFERCWPGAGQGHSRARNTEIFTFDGDRIAEVEVYFGWNVD